MFFMFQCILSLIYMKCWWQGDINCENVTCTPLLLTPSIKGKVIPITGHEGPRGTCMQRFTYTHPRRQEEVWQLVLARQPSLPGKLPILILKEAEWTSGPVWSRRCEEISPPLLRDSRRLSKQIYGRNSTMTK